MIFSIRYLILLYVYLRFWKPYFLLGWLNGRSVNYEGLCYCFTNFISLKNKKKQQTLPRGHFNAFYTNRSERKIRDHITIEFSRIMNMQRGNHRRILLEEIWIYNLFKIFKFEFEIKNKHKDILSWWKSDKLLMFCGSLNYPLEYNIPFFIWTSDRFTRCKEDDDFIREDEHLEVGINCNCLFQ